jgi:hypothetical protein
MANTENSQGRPWMIVGTFPTFEAATSRAEIERATHSRQVKIKQTSDGYTVRTRPDIQTVVDSKKMSSPAEKEEPNRSKLKAKDRRAQARKSVDSEEE